MATKVRLRPATASGIAALARTIGDEAAAAYAAGDLVGSAKAALRAAATYAEAKHYRRMEALWRDRASFSLERLEAEGRCCVHGGERLSAAPGRCGSYDADRTCRWTAAETLRSGALS